MKRENEQEHRTSPEAGMSLVETVISMFMLTLAIVGLGQGLILGISMNTESKTRVSNLSLCKQFLESAKGDIQASQTAFDTANTNAGFNRDFYVDINGQEITSSPGTASYSFKVSIGVSDWKDSSGNSMSVTDATGASHVVVRVLTVRVVAQQSAVQSNDPNKVKGSSREIVMQLEAVRPLA